MSEKSKMYKKQIKRICLIQIIFLFSFFSLFALVHSSFVSTIPQCFWLENYNIYCPSCGSTRCIINLINGNFAVAFFYNPFLFIFLCYLVLFNVIYIINTVFQKKILIWFYPKWWYIIVYFALWAIYTVLLNLI